MDFSLHRLNNEADLLAYHSEMGNLKFWEYADKLFTRVEIMKPGEQFRVNDWVKEENRDLFIKLLCWYIISGLAPECLFNETFTVFKRRNMQDFEPQIVNNNWTKKTNGNDNR